MLTECYGDDGATVDTTEAGDGDILVSVTYDGRQMVTQVSRSEHLYHVSFLPEGPGVYSVEVLFADMEVTGMLALDFASFVSVV